MIIEIASFILNNPVSLVEADINIVFNLIFDKKFDPNDIPKRNMIFSAESLVSNI